jgi:hypothetical protein
MGELRSVTSRQRSAIGEEAYNLVFANSELIMSAALDSEAGWGWRPLLRLALTGWANGCAGKGVPAFTEFHTFSACCNLITSFKQTGAPMDLRCAL